MDNYNTHVACMKFFDQETPKTHIVWHMLVSVMYFGNPRVYSNWIDEDLNRTLKNVCRGCSQLAFESCLLLRVRDLLRGSLKRPATV